jgi:dipeptidyl aminopeptidase/acylaminoacyl peptidase
MLSGQRAFKGSTPADTLSAILNHDPKGIGPLASGPLPPTLEAIIHRCLEKDPDERFQSARDLGFALKAVLTSTPAEPTPAVRRHPSSRAPWLAVGAILAIAAAGGLWWRYVRADRTLSVATGPVAVAPFTTFPGLETAPTFSPDGSQIAFAWSPEGSDGADLYTKVIGSEKPLRLTTHPALLLTPAWSPDGTQIAFARLARDGGGIYVVPALGGPERKLADAEFTFVLETLLSWSPDGATSWRGALTLGVSSSRRTATSGRSRSPVVSPGKYSPVWTLPFLPSPATVAVSRSRSPR